MENNEKNGIFSQNLFIISKEYAIMRNKNAMVFLWKHWEK